MKRALNFLSLSRNSALAASEPSDRLPDRESLNTETAHVIPQPSPADLSSPVWNDKSAANRAKVQTEWLSDEMTWVQTRLAPWTRWKILNNTSRAETLKWLFTFWRFLVLARRAAKDAPDTSEQRANPAEWLEESLRERDFLKAQLETLVNDVTLATAEAAEARRRERRAREESFEVTQENMSLKSQLQQVSNSLDSSLGAFTKTLENDSLLPNLDDTEWKKTMLEEYDRAVACGRSQAFARSDHSTPAHSNIFLDDVNHTAQGSIGRFSEPHGFWDDGPGIQKGRSDDSFMTPQRIRSPAAPSSTIHKYWHHNSVRVEQLVREKEEEHIFALEETLLRILDTQDKLSKQIPGRRELHGWAAKEQALSERVFSLQREVVRRKEMGNEATRQLARAMDRLATAETRIEELEDVVQRTFKDSESRQWMHEQVTKQHAALRQLSEEVARRQELVTKSGESLQAELDSERQLSKMLEQRLANADANASKVKRLEDALGSAEKRAADSAREARQLRAMIENKRDRKDVGCDAWTPVKLELSRIWAVDDCNQHADAEGQVDIVPVPKPLHSHGITLSRRGGVARGEEGVPEMALSKRGSTGTRSREGLGSDEEFAAAQGWDDDDAAQTSKMDDGVRFKHRGEGKVGFASDSRGNRPMQMPAHEQAHSPGASSFKLELGRLWDVLGSSSQ